MAKLNKGKLPVTGKVVQTGKRKLKVVKGVPGCQYCFSGDVKILKPCGACGH